MHEWIITFVDFYNYIEISFGPFHISCKIFKIFFNLGEERTFSWFELRYEQKLVPAFLEDMQNG